MLSASGVLDAYLDLKKRTHDPRFYSVLEDGFAADWHAAQGDQETIARNAINLADRTVHAVEMARLYRVTPNMVDLLLHAAAGLDEEDTFDLELPPTSHGLVHFARPIPVKELRGDIMLGHWLLWFPMQIVTRVEDPLGGGSKDVRQPTMMMVWWNDDQLQRDVVWERTVTALVEQAALEGRTLERHDVEKLLADATGRWNWIGGNFLTDGAPLGKSEYLVPQDTLDHERELKGQDTCLATQTTNLPRVVHTLWIMLNQTVAATHDESIARPTVKRAQRAKVDPRVTLIQLRREREYPIVDPDAEGEAHAHHHHWICSGHWRWQPYGPGRTQRRRIWIHSHIRGPLDKPLLATEKIFNLER